MSDLYLIGYTADLRHLVLDPDPTATSGRYWLAVDDDVLLTVDEVRELRHEAGFDDPEPPVVLVAESLRAADGDRPDEAAVVGTDGADASAVVSDGRPEDAGGDGDPGDDPSDEPIDDPIDDAAGGGEDADGDVEAGDDRADRADVGTGATDSDAPDGDASEGEPTDRGDDGDDGDDADGGDGGDEGGAVDDAGADSELSPAEIQQQLRAGRSPSTVAEKAGTDISWVERWLPPIIAERDQVISEAQAATLERQRLGRSERPLGDAVSRNLAERSVDPDDISWSTRRRKDGTWTVTVRYRSRGRARRASWRFDRDAASISPASDLARELGFVRSRRRRSR